MLINQHRMNSVKVSSLYDIHRRLGHISYDYLKRLIKSDAGIVNAKIIDWEEKQCLECVKANITRSTIPKTRSSSLASKFGDHLHTSGKQSKF